MEQQLQNNLIISTKNKKKKLYQRSDNETGTIKHVIKKCKKLEEEIRD